MKTTFKFLACIFALGVVILLGLHIFLQYGLTKAMRAVVLPRIQQETGIDLQVRSLSLNVPGGILYLNGVSVKNPAGYPLENLASIDRIYVELDSVSMLLQKPILIHKVQLENALVNIIRTEEGILNSDEVLSGLPQVEEVPAEKKPAPLPEQPEMKKVQPLPEMLIKRLLCNARVRYLDMNYTDLDLALDLAVSGNGLSTQQAPNARWGTISVKGALGSERTSFKTDLNIKLAPLTDLAAPSFALAGEVMKIDPRIMDKVYSRMGIRCAPFSIEPDIHCRVGTFEHSSIALELRDVELEDKLAKRLGGMASIGALRIAVPLTGTLQEPRADLKTAFSSAMGGNAKNVLSAILKGAAGKEADMDAPPSTLTDAAIAVLGKHVEDVGKSETAKKILKDLAGGESSATNAPSGINTDDLIELLEEQIGEDEDHEEIKEGLRILEKAIFGK